MNFSKSRQIINNSTLIQALSDSKLSKNFKRKVNEEGCIRKQLLSPNNSNSAVLKDISKQFQIYSNTNMVSPTSKQAVAKSKKSIKIAQEDQELFVKLRQLILDNDNAPSQNSFKKRIDQNQKESDEMEKLKQELKKSYNKLKVFEKRQLESERKNIQLQQKLVCLQKELSKVNDKYMKKDDLIFNLEQRIESLVNQNNQLHERINVFEINIIQLQNKALKSNKILDFENHPEVKKYIEKNSLQLEGMHRQMQRQLQKQIQLLELKLCNLQSKSIEQLKKQKYEQQLHFLFAQASTIQALLKQ